VYQRDAHLVHVVRVDDGEADAAFVVGTPQIRVMGAATLRERLTRVARFQRFEKRSKTWVDALPSEPIVQAILARGEYARVRPLIGVIESPSIRPDGSIIQTPGYDRVTAYLYTPSGDFPIVPDRPSQADAARALAELEEPFSDFPFAGSEHRASTIAALLTIIARPAILGSTPAIVHDANVRGSGKTLKADAVSTIATGRPTAKMNYPDDDVELEKILAAYAIRGATVISFDNVVRTFGGGPLDRCLTAGDMVELRVLGRSEVPSLRWRAVVMATGNNVALSGDTSRRTIMSRLESPLENPEERQAFTHPNLLEWLRENRPRLVVAALTMLRAWYVAGSPHGGCRSWGSFESWSGIIPPAIVFAGGADPMRTRPAATGEEDGDKRALVVLVDGLARLDPTGQGLTAKSIVDALYSHRDRGSPPDGFDDLREAIDALTSPIGGKPPSTNKLGYALRRFRRRVVGSRMLDCIADRNSISRWSVLGLAKAPTGAGDAGDAGDVSNPSRVSCQDILGGSGQNITRNHPHHPQGEFGEYLEGGDSLRSVSVGPRVAEGGSDSGACPRPTGSDFETDTAVTKNETTRDSR
jgi:hypothetical protein